MSYTNAIDLLPSELLKEIQKYVDGEYIYIPRNESNKKAGGPILTGSLLEEKMKKTA